MTNRFRFPLLFFTFILSLFLLSDFFSLPHFLLPFLSISSKDNLFTFNNTAGYAEFVSMYDLIENNEIFQSSFLEKKIDKLDDIENEHQIPI